MQAETPSPGPAAADPRSWADLWRAGCLDAAQAREFEAACAADPALAAQARYGRELARSLHELPRLAARRAARAAPRRLRWPRVLAAAGSVATLAGLGFGLLPHLLAASRGPAATLAARPAAANPQLADAVQNLDFYEWLAAHPQSRQRGAGHDGTA